MDRHDIFGLLDQLDHPDAVRQRAVRDRLVVGGAAAVEAILERLRKVNTRTRTGAVQVLADIGDERALLPLMRYVFDERANPAESNPRGLAMQAIMRIAQPEHTAKLFDFLVDMKDDPDAFVRAYVIEAFGKLDDARALPHLRGALDDPAEFVRERAQKTLDAVQMNHQDDPGELSGEHLLREIRRATGARLNYCVKLLSQRDDAFELASALVREDANRTMVGLQVLQELDRPSARDVAVRHYKLTRSDADRAASLRLLGAHLHADARPSEVRTIRQGLEHADKFIQLAALEAAGRSGEPALTRRAVEATRSGDYTAAAAAAEALSVVADQLPAELADELFDSRQMINGHRRHNHHQDLVRTEAYMLRALSKLIEPDDPRSRRAQHSALGSLRRSTDLQPIVITALELLMRLTPEAGYELEDRWHPADAGALVPLLRHANPSVRRRTLEVLRRGAPGDAPNLSQEFERLMRAEADFVAEAVIPAILGTAGPNAKKQLAQLAVADEPAVRRAAESALRRLRNRQPHIDANFRRASD